MVALYAIASGLLAIAVTALVSGYGPPDPFLAVAFLAGEALVLLTLTLALGSVLPSIAAGAIAVVGFGLGWMAGVMAGVATALGVTALTQVAEVESLAAADRRAVARRHLRARAAAGRADRRPAGRRELVNANPFYAATPPPLAFVVWSVAWMALVLGAATWWFERRDL